MITYGLFPSRFNLIPEVEISPLKLVRDLIDNPYTARERKIALNFYLNEVVVAV